MALDAKPNMEDRVGRCDPSQCPVYDEETGTCRASKGLVEEGNICEVWARTIAPENPASALVISFTGPGSAEFGMMLMGLVTPGQMFSLGQHLISRADFLLKMALTKEVADRQASGKILRPGMTTREIEQVMTTMKPE